MSLNICTIGGWLVNEPKIELRKTQNGSDLLSAKVTLNSKRPISRKMKEANPDIQDNDFFSVEGVGAVAEKIRDFFHKGDKVIVSGRIGVDRYKDKNDVERTWVKITVYTPWQIESDETRAEAEARRASQPIQTSQGQAQVGGIGFDVMADIDGAISEDEIPFM